MSNSPSPSAFSASTRPLSAWTPGAVITASSTSSRKQKVYNFNNLNQQDTAQLIQRINRGHRMERSAVTSTRT
ncbi:hypothetical protein ACFV4K_25750 [Nocardia sp. NPDC059764]|uniref:hypothetical protein n=1 Tax=Nocardia sp. NPDC059764 TaxID=3346939 RepID=UPI00365FC586